MAWDSACFEKIDIGGQNVADQVATITCLVPLFARVVKALVSLAGVALFLVLLVGGFNFLFSGGDQKKLEQARGTITGAVIGLVVMVAAYLVVKAIEQFTGVTVTQFKIPVKP